MSRVAAITTTVLWMTISLAIPRPASLAASAGDTPAVAVIVENPTESNRLPGPVTFGMIFARGDMPNTVTVEGLPTQADIKRRWPDGSIKHVIITVALPELPARGRQVLRLIRAAHADGPKAAVPSATDLPEMLIRFAIDRGPAESVRLRRTLQTSKPQRIWLSGPLAVEAHYTAVPANDHGQPDPDLEVCFYVTWYPASRCGRVAAVVENCHWTSPGNVPYDVSILVSGQEVYRLSATSPTW